MNTFEKIWKLLERYSSNPKLIIAVPMPMWRVMRFYGLDMFTGFNGNVYRLVGRPTLRNQFLYCELVESIDEAENEKTEIQRQLYSVPTDESRKGCGSDDKQGRLFDDDSDGAMP